MGSQEKIAGGVFVSALLLLTIQPFNNSIQALATVSGAGLAERAIGVIYPIMHVGLMFIIMAFTGNEIIEDMT